MYEEAQTQWMIHKGKDNSNDTHMVKRKAINVHGIPPAKRPCLPKSTNEDVVQLRASIRKNAGVNNSYTTDPHFYYFNLC